MKVHARWLHVRQGYRALRYHKSEIGTAATSMSGLASYGSQKAGYPEGCDDQDNRVLLMDSPQEERSMLAPTLVVTQMFYESVDIFLDWVRQC